MTWTIKLDKGKPINWPVDGCAVSKKARPGRYETGKVVVNAPRIGSFGLVALRCQSLAFEAVGGGQM